MSIYNIVLVMKRKTTAIVVVFLIEIVKVRELSKLKRILAILSM